MNKSDKNIRQADPDAVKSHEIPLHEAEWKESKDRLNVIGYERECKGVPYDNPMVQIELTLFDIE